MQRADDGASASTLINAARSVLRNAYAPYSSFPVAAAVRAKDGRMFSGVNIENASYGLTACAERVALFTAISAGARDLEAIAVVASYLRPVMPCGACRQVMTELMLPTAKVYLEDQLGIVQIEAAELLPNAFTESDLRSAKRPP